MIKETISVDEFIAEARKLIGTKWLHQGRNPSGVDCIGMVTLAIANAGVDPISQIGFLDQKNYSRVSSPVMLEEVKKYCLPLDGPVPGALMLFQFPVDQWPRHFAIYTREGTVIHSNAAMKRVVEHGYRMQWVRWTHSSWMLPGVDYA